MKQDSASSTAKAIAASTILLATRAQTESLVPPNAVDLCRKYLSFSRRDRWLARSASWPLTQFVWSGVESATLPGIVTHYWYRKRWIERRCRAALADGFQRLLVIGAGFDTLAHRLCNEYPELQAVEVDHAATQAAKRRALFVSDISEPATLRFVRADLTRHALPMELLDDDRSTVVIMEGVLMYLSVVTVNRLFAALSAMPAKRLRVIFSFMSKWPDGRNGFRPYSWLIDRWLAWRREPFKWGMEPALVGAFLDSFRLTELEVATARDMAEESGIMNSTLAGENLVLCARD